MHDDYDRSSKWLIQHRGDSILRLAGVRNIRTWRPLQAEVVQPRQLPDGLLEVILKGRSKPGLFILEIATYPEIRLLEQVLRNALLVYLDRRALPEVLTVLLRPRSESIAKGIQSLASSLGWTRLSVTWRVVKLWMLSAESLLAANDVGLIPWVPLTRFRGRLGPLLERCRERIENTALAVERANLLAVTQVLTRLRYNDRRLLGILGGERAMIESPLIQELMAERMQKDIIRVLAARFGTVPPNLTESLGSIQDPKRLEDLLDWAACCPDLNSFQRRLKS